jgi:outer membrane lipoprotein
MKLMRAMMLLVMVAMLAACASTQRFDTSNVDTKTSPEVAVQRAEAMQGKALLWGGIIINVSNQKSLTQFEILAYPLDANHRPLTDRPPQGRFLARQDGYVEAADYAQGRLLTVSGLFEETVKGKIGDSEYTYPVLKISQKYLWPRRTEDGSTRFHFGIGVMFRN